MLGPLRTLCEKIRKKPLLSLLIVLLVMLVVLFSFVMCCETVEEWVGRLLGLRKKNEILKFLGISMGGVVLVLQAVIANRRAKAMEEQAEAQVKATKEQAKANEHTEQGQRQERLKNAIEHLGHESVSVRLGGAYELFHLAKDATEDTKKLHQTVMDILCAHIRQTTKTCKEKPSEEVQSLLTLLFVQEYEVFKGLHIDLQGSCLRGANLSGARLKRAILNRANLRGANLSGAHLQGAHLSEAHLQGAFFRMTHLQGAHLDEAHLQGAHLDEACLQGADLRMAHLQGAHLREACLQGASLRMACLQGANLSEAQLQGADLDRVQLQGVTSTIPLNGGTFEDRINESIDKAVDLSGVTFSGRLSSKDIESITGRYTAQEAAQWIAEYRDEVEG